MTTWQRFETETVTHKVCNSDTALNLIYECVLKHHACNNIMNQALDNYMLAGGKNSIGLRLKYKNKYIFPHIHKGFYIVSKMYGLFIDKYVKHVSNKKCWPLGSTVIYEDIKRHTKYLQQPNLLQYWHVHIENNPCLSLATHLHACLYVKGYITSSVIHGINKERHKEFS